MDDVRIEYRIGDSAEQLKAVPAASVHFAMTSPPYWALRDYQVAGQIGLEKTPAEYIASLMAVFDQLHRALRDDGTLVVNIGDTYFGDSPIRGGGRRSASRMGGLRQKSLTCIPERFVLAMIERGWILRNKVVWHKTNCMPTSAGDRLRCSWEPCFVFSKQGKYYSDLEAVRRAHAEVSITRSAPHRADVIGNIQHPQCADGQTIKAPQFCNPAGANPGDVLELASQPSPIKHSAMYPVRLPLFFCRWLMPRKVCPECGKAWRRNIKTRLEHTTRKPAPNKGRLPQPGERIMGEQAANRTADGWIPNREKITTTLGWSPGCKCGKEPVGPTILDPFAGPGTTAAAAEWLWRNPAEGMDTVLANARTVPTRPGSGSKFVEGDGSKRPEYAKARMVRTGTPTNVLQPFLPGKAVMIDLDARCEGLYRARRDECFDSLGKKAEVSVAAAGEKLPLLAAMKGD